jgi:hypothetical protein
LAFVKQSTGRGEDALLPRPRNPAHGSDCWERANVWALTEEGMRRCSSRSVGSPPDSVGFPDLTGATTGFGRVDLHGKSISLAVKKTSVGELFPSFRVLANLSER